MTLADIIILYKEFPHTDVVERAEDLLTWCCATIRGEIKPVMSLYDCRQIGSYPTTLPLMRGFVDRIKALEGKDGVLSVSIGHCFPYADVPELTGRILVVADSDKAKADRLATEIGAGVRLDARAHRARIPAGGRRSRQRWRSTARPVVMADPADNAGGGAPSDNTTMLRQMIERNVEDAALGPIWDPIAVRLCFDAGEGAVFPLRFGGKTGPASGPADRCGGDRHRAEARLLAELRPDAGAAR